MTNQGHYPKVQISDKNEADKNKLHSQPSQKSVKSKPMSFSTLDQTNNPLNKDLHSSNNHVMDQVQGGSLVAHLHNKSLIDTMQSEQLRAAT